MNETKSPYMQQSPNNGADLISRADAIGGFYNAKVHEEDCTEYDIGYNDGIDYAISKLSILPSTEAVQGEWKQTITRQPYCSNCEYVFGEDEEFSPFWKYCPMCGARNKGGAE